MCVELVATFALPVSEWLEEFPPAGPGNTCASRPRAFSRHFGANSCEVCPPYSTEWAHPLPYLHNTERGQFPRMAARLLPRPKSITVAGAHGLSRIARIQPFALVHNERFSVRTSYLRIPTLTL